MALRLLEVGSICLVRVDGLRCGVNLHTGVSLFWIRRPKRAGRVLDGSEPSHYQPWQITQRKTPMWIGVFLKVGFRAERAGAEARAATDVPYARPCRKFRPIRKWIRGSSAHL